MDNTWVICPCGVDYGINDGNYDFMCSKCGTWGAQMLPDTMGDDMSSKRIWTMDQERLTVSLDQIKQGEFFIKVAEQNLLCQKLEGCGRNQSRIVYIDNGNTQIVSDEMLVFRVQITQPLLVKIV